MVYTISLNTAIDEIIIAESNIQDIHNIIKDKQVSLGGKAIKTNVLLSKKKIDNLFLGIVGGENGKIYEEVLKQKGIKSKLIKSTTYKTRKTTIIVDDTKGGSTMFVENSQPISEEDKENFFKNIKKIKEKSIVLIAGSLPEGFSIIDYSETIKILKKKLCYIVCDASGEALNVAIKNEVSFIKPNEEEFINLFNIKEITEDYVHDKLKNIPNYALTLGSEGSIYKYQNIRGRIKILETYAIENKIKSTTGCGDMFVAGYILGVVLKQNPIITGTKYSMAKALSYYSDNYEEKIIKKIENYLEDECYI